MTPQQPDSLRTILDSVFAAPAYRWVQRPEPLGALRRAWLHVKDWFLRMSDSNPLVFRMVFDLLLAATILLVLHAAWTFYRDVGKRADPGPPERPLAGRRDEAWYRDEADRLAHAGRFAEAVQLDFLALVLALDARDAVRFHPSKTPAEYAHDSALAPFAREEFGDLVRRLYSFAFARSPCGPAEFADWRSRTAPERYARAH